MNFKTKVLATAFLFGVALSCTDTSDLKVRLDELESRVTSLEKVVSALNGNVESLQAVIEGKTINSVEEAGGVYTITLSNGQVLTLTQGSVGIGKAPIMSVDKNGYWMVDYQDGKGPVYLLYESNKVVAVGHDGITPVFSVSADGYWTVSYDEGKTFKEVKDVNGNFVKAVAEGSGEDSYFAGVSYTDEALTLTLKNGEQYVAPVVGGFLFKINSGEGDQVFKYGEKKTFGIEKKGISDAVVICPTGWKAWFTDLILTVQAPDKPAEEKKATIADSRKDVSVIAYSQAGHIAVSKVKVYIDGGGGSYDDPAAGVRFISATSSQLVFNVVLEYSSSWYWKILESTVPAPTAAELVSSGTKGDDSRQIVADGLKAETAYTVYVLPVNERTQGAIANCESSTSGFEDFFAAWEAGYDVKVGGVPYNKSEYGSGTHVTGAFTIVNPGVYFVDSGVKVSLAHNPSNPYRGSLIIIGNEPDGRAELVFKQGNGFNKGTESLDHYVIGFKNLTIGSQDSGYKCFGPNWWGDSDYGRVVFDNCRIDIKGVIMQKQASGQSFKDLTIINCDICVQDDKARFVENWNGSGFEMGSFTAKNNVVWAQEGEKRFQFIAAEYASGIVYQSIVMENNTFYNVNTGDDTSKANHGMVTVASVKTAPVIRNNLAYTGNPLAKNNINQKFFTAVKEKNCAFEVAYGQLSPYASGNWSDFPQTTLVGGTNGCSSDWTFSFTMGVVLENNLTVVSFVNPFESEDPETGVFVKKSAYKAYGAER